MKRAPPALSLLAAAGFACAAAAPARADAVADFYGQHHITITVGGTSGGGYAVYTRAFADVIGDFVPGHPSIVVQYMPGASTIRAARKDGTEMGAFQQPVLTIPFTQSHGVHFDPGKFIWLGSLASDVSLCFARADSGVATFKEARKKQITIGANAPSASSTTIPT